MGSPDCLVRGYIPNGIIVLLRVTVGLDGVFAYTPVARVVQFPYGVRPAVA